MWKKSFLIIAVLLFMITPIFAGPSVSDVIHWIATGVGVAENVVEWSIGGIIATGVLYLLKRYRNAVQLRFGQFMFGLGVTVTLGLSKWKWTAGFWNKTIEPVIIDLINDIVIHGLRRFIGGMKSDNKPVNS